MTTQDLISTIETKTPHSELRKTWTPDDYWQVLVVQWCPGRWTTYELGLEPLWSEETQYRIHPHNEMMKAFDAGKKIQWNDGDGNWITTKLPEWDDYEAKYQIKPKKKDKTPKVGDLVMVWDDDICNAELHILEPLSDEDFHVGYQYTANGVVWENCLSPKQWDKKVSKLNERTNS